MLRTVTFVALISAISAQPCFADSITVTGGTLSESTSSVADFSLTGSSFSLTGSITDSSGLLQQCLTCEPEAPFKLRSWWEFEGTMELNGTTTEVIGRLKFNGGSLSIPDLAVNEGTALTRMFTFVGKVTPTDGGRHLNLHGRGEATLNFFRHEGEGVLPTGINFSFASDPLQHTPEPATLALVGSGLAAAAFARRRRKAR
jgi:hypothetical protein